MNLKELIDNYQSNKFQIEKRKEIRLKIENEIYEVHSPNCIQFLSDMPKSNKQSDQTSEAAIRIISEKDLALKSLNKMISVLEQEVKVVDSLIATLKYKDQVFVRKIIDEKKQLTDIMYELNYSDYRSVQRIHSRIMNELQKEYKKRVQITV